MRNRLIVEQRLFLSVAPGGEAELPFFVLEKNVAAFTPRQLQRDVEHGHQNFVEHASSIQFAGGLKK